MTESGSGDEYEIGFAYRADVPWRVDEVDYPGTAISGTFGVKYDYDMPTGTVTAVHPASNTVLSYWQLTDVYEGYRLKGELFGNGVSSKRSYYDANSTCETGFACMTGQLASLITSLPGTTSLAPVQSESFFYDANGNLGRHDTKVTDAPNTTYTYRFDRLERAVSTYSSSVQVTEDYVYL